MAHGSARSERDGWMDDNTRGLSLAAAADWDEAAEAFAAAADVLARRAPDVSSHDALALILGNLAQACFRAGRTEDALLHAQRSCALRVALAGEDAMPVARERMDLAVMLGALGRLDEAQALMQRAISAVERHVGDEDARLVVMLENAARLALAAGVPANAEPLLLRLHALLDAHGMSTDRADRLLAMVSAVRSRADANRAETSRIAAVRAEVMQAEAMQAEAAREEVARTEEVAVYAHASIDEQASEAEWDDQPLRDAVAITDVLLRTTPSGVIAIQEPVNHDAEILAAFETVVDTPVEPMIDLVDDLPTAAVDIALDLADDFGLPPEDNGAPSMGLGFTIEHGLGASDTSAPVLDASTDLMGLELDDALADSLVDVPTHRPALELEEAAPSRIEAFEPAPVVSEPLSPLNAPLRPPMRHVEPAPAHGFGPPPAALVTPGARMEPASAPAPMPPTARDMTRAQDAQNAADADEASAHAAHRAGRTGRTPLSDRHPNEAGGKSTGLIGAGIGAALAVGGAVWYFLLR
ncbi:tetratricopeptide repeat protein [Gemmatimonas groenlandica]|uniref:Tetratricopeptide repeat protein n=1 Tax=Gemmatimonas groenlandica TaxID=2732249 RepID=A0A6M4IJ65_9BACT|nr:tetratricopeptide repeat protein [Gemmatimonas groenlandica]QJR34660.1 tetratricopeptide repeat protein [Gemmatimonas groenlandica]